MKKGQYFIIASVIIALLILPSFLFFNETTHAESKDPTFFVFENVKNQLTKTIDLSAEQEDNSIYDNLNNFSNVIENMFKNIKVEMNYSVDEIIIGGGSEILFEEDFQDYLNINGSELYSELENNGWEVYDYAHPYDDDDIYLDGSSDKYVVIQDNSYISAQINTSGYENITLQYDRRGYNLEEWQSDDFDIRWRVGDSGGWDYIESIDTSEWEVKTWDLVGAEDKELIQVRFFLDGHWDYNDDFGNMDDFSVSGYSIEESIEYNVTIDLRISSSDLTLEDHFNYCTMD